MPEFCCIVWEIEKSNLYCRTDLLHMWLLERSSDNDRWRNQPRPRMRLRSDTGWAGTHPRWSHSQIPWNRMRNHTCDNPRDPCSSRRSDMARLHTRLYLSHRWRQCSPWRMRTGSAVPYSRRFRCCGKARTRIRTHRIVRSGILSTRSNIHRCTIQSLPRIGLRSDTECTGLLEGNIITSSHLLISVSAKHWRKTQGVLTSIVFAPCQDRTTSIKMSTSVMMSRDESLHLPFLKTRFASLATNVWFWLWGENVPMIWQTPLLYWYPLHLSSPEQLQ